MRRITVNPQNISYEVVIQRGILNRTGAELSSIFNGGRALLVSDENVGKLYADTVSASLEKNGFAVCRCTFPAGEDHKTLATVEHILECAASFHLSRSDFFVAFGGGVCGDMTGFAAAVYLRGVKFVQIPTTLLAAVDASVGGKTGANLNCGKNLVGAFHQPSCVLFDPDTLSSLSRDQLEDGIAEIIKHSILAGGRLYDIVSSGTLSDNIEEAVALNVEIKSSYVESDPYDTGRRQMLNFGHTIGHAIEKCSNYKISHGHAVAMGMVAETRAFIKLYNEKTEILNIIQNILLKNNINFDIPFSAQELSSAALHDKKLSHGSLNIIAPLGVGNCILRSIPEAQIEAYIKAGL